MMYKNVEVPAMDARKMLQKTSRISIIVKGCDCTRARTILILTAKRTN